MRPDIEVNDENEDEDEESTDEEKPIFTYLKIGAGAFVLLIVIILVWSVWPSSKKERVVSATPSHSVKPPTASPATKQSPAQATNTPKAADTGSDSRKEAIVPNLVGLAQADAEKQALSAGLHYNYLLEASGQPKGTVTKQDPPAGTKGNQGDNVTFWVSKGNS